MRKKLTAITNKYYRFFDPKKQIYYKNLRGCHNENIDSHVESIILIVIVIDCNSIQIKNEIFLIGFKRLV